MKKKNKVDKIYSDAVSTIVKYFISPSLLVDFLSTIARYVYEYGMKNPDEDRWHRTHNITMELLSYLVEPWIDNDLSLVEINVWHLKKTIGYRGLNTWVTEVIYVTSKAEIEGRGDTFTVSGFWEYFTCFNEVAEAFHQVDCLNTMEPIETTQSQ